MPGEEKAKKIKLKQARWEKENKQFLDFQKQALTDKPLARKRGYGYRYFDFLDSNETIFKELASEARIRYPSLIQIAEVTDEEFEGKERSKWGVQDDWKKIVFSDQNESANTYNDKSHTGNIRGLTEAFYAPDNSLRCLILIPSTTRCEFQHRDYKYHFKLISLLHEIGHVDDLENGKNFNCSELRCDIISAEVYAHLFAINEAYKLGLFTLPLTLINSLRGHLKGRDYRAEVARRVIEGHKKPEFVEWTALLYPDATKRAQSR